MKKKTKSPARRKAIALGKISMKEGINDAKNVGSFMLGLWAGRKVMVQVDKLVTKTGADQAIQGIFGFDGSKLVPVAVGAAGLTVAQFLKRPEFKYFSYGVAGSGAAESVKRFFGKDMLAGLGEGTDGRKPIPGLGNSNLLSLPAMDAATRTFMEGLSNTDTDTVEEEDLNGTDDEVPFFQ